MLTIDRHFPFLHNLTSEDLFNMGWAEANDREGQILKLTAPELVNEYQKAKVANDDAECMLIEHFLSLRLVTIQVEAMRKAAKLSFIGAILAGCVGYALSQLQRCF